jgi:hypothetical protein
MPIIVLDVSPRRDAPSRCPHCSRRGRCLTGARPYRQSLDPAEAIEELVRCSGSQFDPTVVAIVAESVKQRIAA